MMQHNAIVSQHYQVLQCNTTNNKSVTLKSNSGSRIKVETHVMIHRYLSPFSSSCNFWAFHLPAPVMSGCSDCPTVPSSVCMYCTTYAYTSAFSFAFIHSSQGTVSFSTTTCLPPHWSEGLSCPHTQLPHRFRLTYMQLVDLSSHFLLDRAQPLIALDFVEIGGWNAA